MWSGLGNALHISISAGSYQIVSHNASILKSSESKCLSFYEIPRGE